MRTGTPLRLPGMEFTSKALREAEFREKRGGYHPEDVDRLLEEAADGVDALHERLRQAVDRAQKAEAAAESGGSADETLKRTLVLAQRTADMAIQEAREQATKIVAAAEQKADALLADAEQRANRAHDEAIADIRSDLVSLEAVRSRGQQEVDILNNWVQEHRSHLSTTLKEALGVVERAGTLSPAPSTHPIEVGSRPHAEGPVSGPAVDHPNEAPAGKGSADDPTAAWAPPDVSQDSDAGEVPFGAPRHLEGSESEAEANGQGNGEVTRVAMAADPAAPALEPDEQAIADFFDADELEDDDEEPRFGGRLRRRR